MLEQKAITKKTLFFIILLMISSLPGLYLSYISITTAFELFIIGRANFSLASGHISDFVISAINYKTEHIGGELIQYHLINLTDWALDSIALLPVGSLLSSLLFYGISKKLSGSTYIGACVAIFSSWFYPRLIIQFDTSVHVWTNILFLSFLLVYYYWLKNQKLLYFILLVALFLATFYYYHTTPIWMITIIFISYFIKIIVGKNNNLKRLNITWAAPFIFGVIYLQFDTVIYESGLSKLAGDTTSSDFYHNVILRFITPLLRITPEVMKPFEVAPVSPLLATIPTLLILLLITIPVGIWCLIKIFRTIKYRDINKIAEDENDLFCWAMIGASIVHTLMYGFYGTTDIRVLQITFPLILPLIYQQIKLNKFMLNSMITLVALLAVVGFYGFSTALTPYMTMTKLGVSPNLIKSNDLVLADANTYGSLLAAGTEDGKIFGYVWPTPEIYEQLVDSNKIESNFSYIFAEKTENPISTNDWVFLESWENNLEAINKNDDLEKVYESDHLVVFQRKEFDLPINFSEEVLSISLNENKAFSNQVIRLFFTLIFLFFLPGIAFLNLLNPQSRILNDFDSVAPLTVGFSVMVITFIGYILNFTSIGLNQFNLLVLVFIISGITFPIIVRRNRLRNKEKYFISILLFFTSLLVWSFLATNANQLRVSEEADFVEFYITHDANKQNSIDININNRKNETLNFSIIIDNGAELLKIGDYKIAPHSTFTRELLISNEFIDKKMYVYLYHKGVLISQLHFYYP